MEDKNKVILSGYYGFDNSGDDAILKAVISDLKVEDENLDITVFSKNPDKTKKNYGVKSIDRFNIISIIKEIYNTDIFISGGGSLLQDVTSTKSIIYYLALIYISKILNKPVIVYANGIGPINRKFNRFLTKKMLNKVDKISLRDVNSKKTVEDLGVKNKNITVTADPVYTLKPADKKRVKEILNYENIPTDKPLIGVAIRDWNNSDKLLKVIPEAIDYISNNYNANVILIPMHYPEDLRISKKAIDLTKTDCFLISEKYSVEELMGVINNLEMIIAMRLHSLIYAATQAVPMVGIVYDPKVDGFMDTIGLESKINIDELEKVELFTKIENVWNNKTNINKHLLESREKFRKKAHENVKMVLDLLKSR
ncbi:MAG: polysaccharide pyruvyl transferase CsaB [Firmicutes bacterium]|nr:polysaccharide pyruvyl transferase CsaB [Bacillota bacterium]